jgi:hypothetical protein
MEIPGYKAPFTAQQAALRKYPLQFLCNLAYAVLNNQTGNLLEYRHLMKHPKYKDVWTKSFRTEIRCLTTTTKPSSLLKRTKYQMTGRAMRHMQELYVCIATARRTCTEHASQWVET